MYWADWIRDGFVEGREWACAMERVVFFVHCVNQFDLVL